MTKIFYMSCFIKGQPTNTSRGLEHVQIRYRKYFRIFFIFLDILRFSFYFTCYFRNIFFQISSTLYLFNMLFLENYQNIIQTFNLLCEISTIF